MKIILPIMHNSPSDKARYLESIELPGNYMEDFTIMGILVDDVDRALQFLISEGFSTQSTPTGKHIILDSNSEIPQLIKQLTAHKFTCDYSDIADTIYQA